MPEVRQTGLGRKVAVDRGILSSDAGFLARAVLLRLPCGTVSVPLSVWPLYGSVMPGQLSGRLCPVLTLTRKTDYALVALAELACAAEVFLSARQLAERTQLPHPILRNLLKKLAIAGILTSEKGASGGYRLARDPRGISAMAVIEAVDRPVQLARCCSNHLDQRERDAGACTCPLERRCRIRTGMARLQNRMLDLLGRTTLRDLLYESAATTESAESAFGRCACRFGVRDVELHGASFVPSSPLNAPVPAPSGHSEPSS